MPALRQTSGRGGSADPRTLTDLLSKTAGMGGERNDASVVIGIIIAIWAMVAMWPSIFAVIPLGHAASITVSFSAALYHNGVQGGVLVEGSLGYDVRLRRRLAIGCIRLFRYQRGWVADPIQGLGSLPAPFRYFGT